MPATTELLLEESRRRPAVVDFGCGEERVKDGDEVVSGTVLFYCDLPPPPRTKTGRDSSLETAAAAAAAATATNESSAAVVQQQQQQQRRLTFRCRAPSCGALLPGEIRRQQPPSAARCCSQGDDDADDDDDDSDAAAVDPNFFDAAYPLAAATGFQVWTGTRFLLEALCWPLEGDCERLQYWQRRLLAGHSEDTSDDRDHRPPLRVLELGAGTGVAGAYLAAAGAAAEVLLTDLPPLVRDSVAPNLLRNGTRAVVVDDDDDALSSSSSSSSAQNNSNHHGEPSPRPPSWLCRSNEDDPDDDDCGAGAAVRVAGRGWAAAAALDWRRPAAEQLAPHQMAELDLIVASDGVFLVDMLESLLDTVAALFAIGNSNSSGSNNQAPSLLLSFQRRDARDGDASPTFTTVRSVRTAVQDRGWTLECLAWRPATVPGPTAAEPTITTQVFLYEIRAPHK